MEATPPLIRQSSSPFNPSLKPVAVWPFIVTVDGDITDTNKRHMPKKIEKLSPTKKETLNKARNGSWSIDIMCFFMKFPNF